MKMVQAYISGDLSRAEYVDYIKFRDEEGNFEVDAAGFNFYYIDILLDLYTDAKFILTIRDCYSWVNSCVGYIFKRYHTDEKKRFLGSMVNNIDYLPGNRFEWTDRSEYKVCIRQLAKMWAVTNENLLRSIPTERLLVVNTDSLSLDIQAIARFVGASENGLNSDHANRGDGINYLACFDTDKIEAVFNRYCSALMAERFPEMTLSDFMLSNEAGECADRSEVMRVFSLDNFVRMV